MSDLENTVSALIELNEPEALIATLKRAAAAKAREFARGLISFGEARRWDNVAHALERVERDLELTGDRPASSTEGNEPGNPEPEPQAA